MFHGVGGRLVAQGVESCPHPCHQAQHVGYVNHVCRARVLPTVLLGLMVPTDDIHEIFRQVPALEEKGAHLRVIDFEHLPFRLLKGHLFFVGKFTHRFCIHLQEGPEHHLAHIVRQGGRECIGRDLEFQGLCELD